MKRIIENGVLKEAKGSRVTIPAEVTKIHSYAFESKLKSIKVEYLMDSMVL